MSRWTDLRDRAVRWLLGLVGYYEESEPNLGHVDITPPVSAVDAPPASPVSSAYQLGLASCWNGTNASERMMNVLSPRMSEAKFKARLDFMLERGCDTAHVFLVNGGDGECAGYRAWKEDDRKTMLKRVVALRKAGLAVVPWIVADDSRADARVLFANADRLVGEMAEFLKGAPYVVLGLEMDEGKTTTAQWQAVRDAVRKYYDGPIGVHHTSGNEFRFAGLGDIILGQLEEGCTEAQIKTQIKAIRAKGKRAVGFEYSRGADRKRARAALDAGAEGCGNW